MKRLLLFLLVLLVAGCVNVDDYKYYEAGSLAANASSNIPMAHIDGLIVKGHIEGGVVSCFDDYYIIGTNIRVDGFRVESYEGKYVDLYGDLNLMPCDAPCICDPLFKVDKIRDYRLPEELLEE